MPRKHKATCRLSCPLIESARLSVVCPFYLSSSSCPFLLPCRGFVCPRVVRSSALEPGLPTGRSRPRALGTLAGELYLLASRCRPTTIKILSGRTPPGVPLASSRLPVCLVPSLSFSCAFCDQSASTPHPSPLTPHPSTGVVISVAWQGLATVTGFVQISASDAAEPYVA